MSDVDSNEVLVSSAGPPAVSKVEIIPIPKCGHPRCIDAGEGKHLGGRPPKHIRYDAEYESLEEGLHAVLQYVPDKIAEKVLEGDLNAIKWLVEQTRGKVADEIIVIPVEGGAPTSLSLSDFTEEDREAIREIARLGLAKHGDIIDVEVMKSDGG